MKNIYLIFITIILTMISCKSEDKDQELEQFLMIDHLSLSELDGSWKWENSNGGISGTSVITPESESYTKTITFEDRIYREYVDSELTLETYYRIDTVINSMYDTKLYTIYYFDTQQKQKLLFDTSNDVVRLFLYDTDCYDCIGTHIYLNNN